MPYSSWMIARLKRETRDHHAAADGDRLRLLPARSTMCSYREALVRIYGFEAPVEAAMATTTELVGIIDIDSRRKLRHLKADLVGLGVEDPPSVPRYRLTPFRGAAEALGWLYVTERNTLLHSVIHRHLSVRIPDVLGRGGAYLAYYERASLAKWLELGMALDRVAADERMAERIVTAADAAFCAQRAWYDDVQALAS
jgi:heme oxygenase